MFPKITRGLTARIEALEVLLATLIALFVYFVIVLDSMQIGFKGAPAKSDLTSELRPSFLGSDPPAHEIIAWEIEIEVTGSSVKKLEKFEAAIADLKTELRRLQVETERLNAVSEKLQITKEGFVTYDRGLYPRRNTHR